MTIYNLFLKKIKALNNIFYYFLLHFIYIIIKSKNPYFTWFLQKTLILLVF